jgi:hypothetical protein
MNDKEGPPALRSHASVWAAGVLVIAVLIVLALLFRGRSHPVTAPLRVSQDVPMKSSPVAVPPLIDSKPLPDNFSKLEICGFGKVPLDTTDSFAVYKYLGAKTKKAAESWLSALLNSGDYRARAAGLFLEGKITGGLALRSIAEPTRDALVQLAVGAGDPAIYSLAVYACRDRLDDPADSACRQISLSGWARMDPDNAVPWLLLAGKAREGQNVAAEADAFNRAARANRIDAYSNSLYAFAEPELPKDTTPLERWYFATEVIGIEAATGLPHYHVASTHCSVEAMQDSNVRQQCNALAELLVTQGTTVLDLMLGARIGARAGWPKQRVNRLTQEHNALMQAINEATPTASDDLWSCNGVHLGNAYVSQRVRLGEVGAARDALDRSDETEQELARRWTETMDKLQHDAMQRQQESAAESMPNDE